MAKTVHNIEVFKNRKGEFCFRKNHDNGKQISKSSESYATKQKCLQGLSADTVITLKATGRINPLIRTLVTYVDLTLKNPTKKMLTIEAEYK